MTTHHTLRTVADIPVGLFEALGLERENTAWMAQGLCAETDPEAFFPEKGESVQAAKAVCSGCPVAAQCLDHALTHGEAYGVWGGYSPAERALMTCSTQPTTDPTPDSDSDSDADHATRRRVA